MAWTAPKTWSTGETLTAANFNAQIRDNELAIGPHLIVRKTADESVTSSTVLQNDDVLALTVAANEIWLVDLNLTYTAIQSTGDLKIAFTFPTAGVVSFQSVGIDASAAAKIVPVVGGTSPTNAPFYGGQGSTPIQLSIRGVYTNGANAGTLQLQWAQNTSNGTSTIVKANSTLWAVKLA